MSQMSVMLIMCRCDIGKFSESLIAPVILWLQLCIGLMVLDPNQGNVLYKTRHEFDVVGKVCVLVVVFVSGF